MRVSMDPPPPTPSNEETWPRPLTWGRGGGGKVCTQQVWHDAASVVIWLTHFQPFPPVWLPFPLLLRHFFRFTVVVRHHLFLRCPQEAPCQQVSAGGAWTV